VKAVNAVFVVAFILVGGVAVTTAIVTVDQVFRVETRDCRHAGRPVIACVVEVLGW
jgi:hypothetical protein